MKEKEMVTLFSKICCKCGEELIEGQLVYVFEDFMFDTLACQEMFIELTNKKDE